ncbi:retrotransposon protein, putative, ty1-copia subclass [Tanacetum coccineum]
MGKTVGELHAMLNEYKKGLPKKAETLQVMMIKGGKIQKANKKSLKAKGKNKVNGKGKDKELTPPYTPQHNGVSERRNRTLLDMVRSMMNLTTLPLSFWDYALESATCILNMVPTRREIRYNLRTNICMAEFLLRSVSKSRNQWGGPVELEEFKKKEDTTPSKSLANFLKRWRVKVTWTAVKNILKYLRNTKDMFLVYSRNPEAELRVNCYCNTGFEIDIDDMKSLTGYVSF